jgi:DNA invertase Pin-like site-specific DNA recombinase
MTTRSPTGRVTPKKTNLRWIIYFRLSIGDPNMQRDAARQRAELYGLVERQGGTVVAELGQGDRSASEFATRKRSEYAEAMRMIDRGEADAIAFSRVDRILRRMDECVDLLRRVRETDLEVWDCSEDEEMRLNTANGRKRLQDKVNSAEYETAIISWRVKRATKARREEKGLPTSGACLGWADTTTICEDEARWVAAMVERVLRGEALTTVARWLNANGVERKRSDRPWDVSSVASVVTTPRNFGLLAFQGEILGPSKVPGICPTESYGQVRSALAERAMPSTRPRNASTLATLVHCSQCGMAMLRQTGGAVRVTLACRRQLCTPRCGAGGIDYQLTEDHITDLVTQWIDGAELADLMAPESRVDTDAIAAELARLEAKLSEATDDWLDDKIDQARYDTISAKVKTRREELTLTLSRATAHLVLAEYVGKPGALAERWPRLATEVKRTIISEALDLRHVSIVVDPPTPGGPNSPGSNVRFDPEDPATQEATWARIRLEKRTD